MGSITGVEFSYANAPNIMKFFVMALCLLTVAFFFHAEGGIRDPLVTGVQTCALPISGVAQALGLLAQALRHNGICEVAVEDPGSEERRVGKECRSRWSPYH